MSNRQNLCQILTKAFLLNTEGFSQGIGPDHEVATLNQCKSLIKNDQNSCIMAQEYLNGILVTATKAGPKEQPVGKEMITVFYRQWQTPTLNITPCTLTYCDSVE